MSPFPYFSALKPINRDSHFLKTSLVITHLVAKELKISLKEEHRKEGKRTLDHQFYGPVVQ